MTVRKNYISEGRHTATDCMSPLTFMNGELRQKSLKQALDFVVGKVERGIANDQLEIVVGRDYRRSQSFEKPYTRFLGDVEGSSLQFFPFAP